MININKEQIAGTVEELKSRNDWENDAQFRLAIKAADMLEQLAAEVERLREAGDAMADKVENGLIIISDGVNLWDNARAALGETQ